VGGEKGRYPTTLEGEKNPLSFRTAALIIERAEDWEGYFPSRRARRIAGCSLGGKKITSWLCLSGERDGHRVAQRVGGKAVPVATGRSRSEDREGLFLYYPGGQKERNALNAEKGKKGFLFSWRKKREGNPFCLGCQVRDTLVGEGSRTSC